MNKNIWHFQKKSVPLQQIFTLMKTKILLLGLFVVAFCGCKNARGTTKVSATGSIYECLIVCPNAMKGDLETVMGADMPCLPQMEPYFKVTQVVPSAFDDFLKSTRNILWVDINAERYTETKAKYAHDIWSTPQVVCHLQAPTQEAAADYWSQYGETIREWFVRQEIDRQGKFLRASTNKEARTALQKTIGVDIWVPEDYMLIKDTTDFVWCCNNKGPMRKDIIVYKYPYTDKNTFTLEYLCQKRDETLAPHITASVEGSYMGTEYTIFPPMMRELNVQHNGYAAEVRGLWKMLGGEAMGGPFVSHTRVDELHGNIVTAEVFVYAAGQKKRNALRQAEAILYTMQLEQEFRQLQEVEVKAE